MKAQMMLACFNSYIFKLMYTSCFLKHSTIEHLIDYGILQIKFVWFTLL